MRVWSFRVSQSPNSDDDYQVDIVVAPRVPPRRPRTPNPAVDEAIQSGEIELPRSLIVRSSSNPPFRERDDKTEPTHAPVMPIERTRGRFGRVVAEGRVRAAANDQRTR